MIAILNYGSGNITAIANILDLIGCAHTIAEDHTNLENSTHFILPGVGAFDVTMHQLKRSFDLDVLSDLVMVRKTPILGICVGMQILTEGSDEGVMSGLGWINGSVKKFQKNQISHIPKMPHLGWNSIKQAKDSILFENIDQEYGFYFLHSYHLVPTDSEDILSVSSYGIDFASSVQRGNIFGVQFHPEKSHTNGITLFRNFSRIKTC